MVEIGERAGAIMAKTEDTHEPPPPLSAGFGSKVQMAARGIASLFHGRKPGEEPAEMASSCDIISADTKRERRVPPGQVKTKRWPVLHAGPTPEIDLAAWSFSLTGLVESPKPGRGMSSARCPRPACSPTCIA